MGKKKTDNKLIRKNCCLISDNDVENTDNIQLTDRQKLRLQSKQIPSDIIQLKNEIKEIKENVRKILELMNAVYEFENSGE